MRLKCVLTSTMVYQSLHLLCFSNKCFNTQMIDPMFKISPCTFPGGDFCSEASKGKAVSPGVKQALKEQQ